MQAGTHGNVLTTAKVQEACEAGGPCTHWLRELSQGSTPANSLGTGPEVEEGHSLHAWVAGG